MWVVLAIILGVSFAAQAEIYKCERADGFVYYQDTNCKSDQDQQTRLLSFIEPVSSSTIQELKKRNTRRAKQQKVKDKKRKQQESKLAKQEQRKQQQCKKIKSQIALIESECRSGYTAKRGKVLQRRKAALLNKKEISCG